jgi:hypothetical protein
MLPATTYGKDHKHSESTEVGADDGIMLPFALDPNPMPGPSPLNRASRQFPDRSGHESKSSRDYFNRPTADHREKLKENNSRSHSAERPVSQSPHIAYQEKGRQPSDHILSTMRKQKDTTNDSPAFSERSRSQHASPSVSSANDLFKLQEVPKNKKADSRRQDSDSSLSPQRPSHADMEMSSRLSRPLIEPDFTSSPPLGPESPETASGSSFSSTQLVERPARGDSLNPSVLRPSGTGQTQDKHANSPTTPTVTHPERTSSTHAPSQLSSGLGISSPFDSSRSFSEAPVPPARSAGRPAPPPLSDTFTSPRAPPQPPSSQHHKASESTSSIHSENSRDVYPPSGLPRYSAQGDFSMDEDFARLLGSQEKEEKDGGVFRRVSNAVHKHGRSLSERGSVNSRGHKKWPTNGSIEISSPTIASPDSREDSSNLRSELRRTQQRVAELEAEKNGLQESMHSAADIRQANTVLREKRNTMAVLDTQREMVIRELEIMTEHLKHAKASNGSMDINQLKSEILKDFANSLQKLKDQLGGQIEDLISKRSELTEEISNLIQMKDKGFQEYESLTAQNTKLTAMNRELMDSMQKSLHGNKKGSQNFEAAANGLGIYGAHHKGGKSELSVDAQGHHHHHEPSFPHMHDAEGEATLAQPQVVNIRKTGKATKFSTLKKGGQAFTKGVSKGFKGAFGSEQKPEEYNVKVIGTPYGSVHQQADLASMTTMSSMPSSIKSREDTQTPKGWFGGSGGGGGKAGANRPPQDRFKPMQSNNSSTNLAVDASTVLFGSDLTARCEFEKRLIPAVVSRCIEEVELRGKFRCRVGAWSNANNPSSGMDVEGVYRKSGGTSQVNQVRSGFEAKMEYDISDPDLDIHSITSALKNYFRRLPVPLITYDVYDQFLEAGREFDRCIGQDD